MWEKVCDNCGWHNDGRKTRCHICGLSLKNEDSLNIGDGVEWIGSKGSHRMMSGLIIAVIPEYMSAKSVLTRYGIRISMKTIADRERPYRSYVVDIGRLAQRPAARYVIPSPFILRKTGKGDGAL